MVVGKSFCVFFLTKSSDVCSIQDMFHFTETERYLLSLLLHAMWPVPSAVQVLLIVVSNCPTTRVTSSILWNCLPQRGSFIFCNRSGLHKLKCLESRSFLLPPHAEWSCGSLAKWQCTLSCSRNDRVPMDADDAPQMLCSTLQWQSTPLRPYGGGWHSIWSNSGHQFDPTGFMVNSFRYVEPRWCCWLSCHDIVLPRAIIWCRNACPSLWQHSRCKLAVAYLCHCCYSLLRLFWNKSWCSFLHLIDVFNGMRNCELSQSSRVSWHIVHCHPLLTLTSRVAPACLGQGIIKHIDYPA